MKGVFLNHEEDFAFREIYGPPPKSRGYRVERDMLNITARQDLMRNICDTISVLVEEARLDFAENDMEIRVVDPSHVAMIRMKVDSAAFGSWEVDETSLGLELVKMRDLLSLGNAGDLIEMKHDEAEGRINLSMGKIDRVIRPLDHSTISPPNVPEKKISSTRVITSLFPDNTDKGKPFAIPFPKTVKSGVRLNNSCAPPLAYLNPVIISSRINSAPFCLVTLSTCCK